MLTNEDYAKAFHEIKNAITIVNSSIQLLEKKLPELNNYAYWNDSRESLDYLKNIVHELSQTRFTDTYPLESVNINSLFNQVLITLQGLRLNDGFEYECAIEENLPLIEADTVRLTQAIINIIKNAYEAMQQSGTMQLNVYQKEQHVYIDIIDFGGGLSEDSERQLFSPFYTSKPNGTGLGLAITKQIVEGHHGSLNYVSRMNDGCTFSIVLPISQQ